MAEGLVFGAFVRPVKGHAVPRYGTQQFLGCARGPNGFEWDEQTIIPLTDEYCRQFIRELNQHFEEKSLMRCTAKEYEAQKRELAKQQTSEGTKTEEPTK
jgi:hypothetical protein